MKIVMTRTLIILMIALMTVPYLLVGMGMCGNSIRVVTIRIAMTPTIVLIVRRPIVEMGKYMRLLNSVMMGTLSGQTAARSNAACQSVEMARSKAMRNAMMEMIMKTTTVFQHVSMRHVGMDISGMRVEELSNVTMGTS